MYCQILLQWYDVTVMQTTESLLISVKLYFYTERLNICEISGGYGSVKVCLCENADILKNAKYCIRKKIQGIQYCRARWNYTWPR